MISRGIVGTLGFRLWIGAPYPPIEIDDDCAMTSDGPATGPGAWAPPTTQGANPI